ncbi:hypothetical protein BJ138DRAFT_665568, partial [Hygrophoropsis aurantiaca]
APLRYGVVLKVGTGCQQAIRVNPPAQPERVQEEEVDTIPGPGVIEGLNDKILAYADTISALQHTLEFISRCQEEDRRQSHADLAAKQATIDSMAEQIADADLAIWDFHRTARITSRRHEEDLSKMQDEVATKQRAIEELKSERVSQQLELIALHQEVLQLKDANSELISVNSTLKAHLNKLSEPWMQ